HTRLQGDWSSDVCSSDLARPPFATKALRQAVASSLDLEQIVKGVWLNVGVPANGPIPPTSWAYDRGIAPIKRDLAKVKAKLAERSEERRVGKEWRCRGQR